MTDLERVFADLRSILLPYVAALDVKKDGPTELYLDTRTPQKNGKPQFFGAVQIKKSAVSYHLMPVYQAPALLDGLSRQLAARMQGKSCFNFTRSDPELLAELASLTEAGFASYEAQGLVRRPQGT